MAKTPKLLKPPVVTIMGHVDHGKTTLLDNIRKSNVASREAGGITQHIGAYQVEHNGKKITFIDTPGHAAFSQMRARGAQITDIVILVVAADDGVKPQTSESIRHIKETGVPVIVAINKMDVKGASPEMVKAQLVQEGIAVEGYGGSVPVVEISARQGKNIDKLLETILLLSELEEITYDPNGPLMAVVIESSLQKNQGPTATLLVKTGVLRQGDSLVAVKSSTSFDARVKLLLSDLGKPVKEAVASTPVKVLGFKEVPSVGTIVTRQEELGLVETQLETSHVGEGQQSVSITAPVFAQEALIEDKQIKIILIADTFGSLEAIRQNISSEIQIIKAATGQVTESDILLAQTTGSVIISFNTNVTKAALKLAELERVPLRSYTIIYKLFEDFETQVLKLLEPTIDEDRLGEAQVLALFEIKNAVIAGCKVTSGKVTLHDLMHLKRGDKIIADGRVVSLKQGKVDVKQVDAGVECGLVLKPQLGLKPGDMILCYKKHDKA